MISYLRLKNFLRHEDTELRFEPEHQLIAVAGNNGSGKSALFDSVVWALYGEAPKNRKIDELVRWGAELEGMEVELEFTLGDAHAASTVYRVLRRRDGVKSSAVLSLQGAPVVEGAKAVTEEITKVLGMDVAGFRVAFVAEQDELDGLASLRPSERARMLSRLLRLDAVEAARHKAREIYNRERKVVHALGHDLDLDEVARQVEEATAERDLYDSQTNEAREAIAKIDERAAELDPVRQRYQAAVTERTRAETTLGGLQEDLARVQAKHGRVEVPEAPDGAAEDPDEVARRLQQLEVALAKAESANQLANQRTQAIKEADEASDRIVELREERAELVSGGDLDGRLQSISGRLDEVSAQRRELDLSRDDLRDQLAADEARLQLARGRAQDVQGLEATCDLCGQEVDDEHRDTMRNELETQLGELETRIASVRTELEAADAQLAQLAAELNTVNGERESIVSARSRVAQLDQELGELVRRERTYRQQAERITVEDVDVDKMYAEKGRLALRLTAAKQAAQQADARDQALRIQADLAEQVVELERRVAGAADALEAAGPDEALQASHAELEELADARRSEHEIVSSMAAEHAAAVERLNAAERDLERAHAAIAKRRTHQHKAQTAENAAVLLAEVNEILATQIRPALQGAVSDLLSRLSAGRFTQAEISETYDVRVLDAGKLRRLSALSGGEQDLVALAVRLALAEVVTARQGVAGIGTLVLDEVFGSQDAGRQATIQQALRGLRDTYGQVLLISHVGGLDETADAVVQVETDAQRETTSVRMI